MKNDGAVSVNTFFKSIAKFSISSWVGFVIGIVAVSLTTRVFTPDVVGTLNMFNSSVEIFVSITLVGMGSALIRFFYELPNGWTLQQLFTRCMFISTMVLLLCSVLIIIGLFNDLFESLLNTKSILVRILFILNALSVLVLTYFLSQFYRFGNDAYRFNIQQILMQFFSKIFVIAAALINPTVEIVLTFNTIGIFLLMIVYIILQRKNIFSWKNGCWISESFNPVYRFAFFSWPNEVVQRFSSFILPYFITIYLSAKDLGVYSSAGFFVAAFAVLQGGFRTYWAAFMYRYYNEEKAKIRKIHSYVGIAIIFLMGLCIIFQHVVYLIVGEAFHGSRLFFTLVLLPPILGLWEQTTSYGISLAKKNEQIMLISFIGVILHVVGIYLCIQWWGLLGAAIGVCLAAVIKFILLSWRGQIYYYSIRSKLETIGGLLVLLVLSASNVIFNQQYVYAVLCVLLMFGITGIVYRKSIKELLSLVHRGVI